MADDAPDMGGAGADPEMMSKLMAALGKGGEGGEGGDGGHGLIGGPAGGGAAGGASGGGGLGLSVRIPQSAQSAPKPQ